MTELVLMGKVLLAYMLAGSLFAILVFDMYKQTTPKRMQLPKPAFVLLVSIFWLPALFYGKD